MKAIHAALAIGAAVPLVVLVASRVESQIAQPACDMPTTPFCDSRVALPPGWSGPVFKLSQDYPANITSDQEPWRAFDPKSQPEAYVRAVLAYFYEGNLQPDVERSFDPAQNKVRHWYNAPWQDFGANGREPIHGLTRERVSRPAELSPSQTHFWNNYAVGFYNAAGAYALGRMWSDHGRPDPSLAAMPDGTVAAKLLFTTASDAEVPYLKGSPEWSAYVYADPNDQNPKPDSPRAVLKLKLLQIDVAVKDSHAGSPTGWVFGTFVYGGGPGGPSGSGWNAVAPVGLMWGNDPGNLGDGAPLAETWLNPAVQMPHVGYHGRLNGPVDNATSSCLSCHSTAETPMGQMTGPDPNRWFRNLASGTPFDAGRQSLDYSLQLAVGLNNFQTQQSLNQAAPAVRRQLIQQMNHASQSPPRDGGLHH